MFLCDGSLYSDKRSILSIIPPILRVWPQSTAYHPLAYGPPSCHIPTANTLLPSFFPIGYTRTQSNSVDSRVATTTQSPSSEFPFLHNAGDCKLACFKLIGYAPQALESLSTPFLPSDNLQKRVSSPPLLLPTCSLVNDGRNGTQ